MMIGVPFAAGAQSNAPPLRISPESAISLALANNLTLESARRSPEIAEFNVRAAESVWTPTVSATVRQSRADSPASTPFDQALGVLTDRRLAAEEQKFLVGLSTSFFVFQAQRDLASARVARPGAVLDRRLSIADLEAVQSAPLTPIR